MSRALFIHPSDNLASAGTLTTQTGTPSSDPKYALAQVHDGNAATPHLAANTGPYALQWDLGSALPVDVVILPMHNFDAGLNVRWQGNAAASWGAPTLDQPIVVPAYLRTPTPYPVGLVLDLRSIVTRSFRFWRLLIPTNSKTIAIGDIAFGVASELLVNIDWKAKVADVPVTVVAETALGSRLGYTVGVLRRKLQGQISLDTDAGLAQLRGLHQAVSNVRAFPFCLDPATEPGMYAAFDDPQLAWSIDFLDSNTITFNLTEQSRGRAL